MASLYLHIPFCEKKCIYCDFYSIENSSTMDDFLRSLHREIELYSSFAGKEKFETIFFGGGTPSLLKPEQLEGILSHLHSVFTIENDAEVTVETNPGTVTREKLAAYQAMGVNRLSIGIQSFRERDLKFLSRIHDAHQAVECVETARAVGFDNLSIDLIYALPDQTMSEWEENLRQAVLLEPNHISAYGLIVEENTPLIRMVRAKLVSPKPADEEAEFYKLTMDFLQERGFDHYEVSNYAREGFRSRHNYNYWRHENYLSFGPSAHSFWREHGNARRWFNIANLSHYCSSLLDGKLPLLNEEHLTPDQLRTERILLGLRSDGLDIGKLEIDFPSNRLHVAEQEIMNLVDSGHVVFSDGVVRLTSAGYLVCDEICMRLMTP
ncbi:MAG: radical SAM family heme chaperone HemW [Ignavibacteriae bacterium]|nr:radical SAM family heme chaperone HemW [Ignavibacteriota bacterium]